MYLTLVSMPRRDLQQRLLGHRLQFLCLQQRQREGRLQVGGQNMVPPKQRCVLFAGGRSESLWMGFCSWMALCSWRCVAMRATKRYARDCVCSIPDAHQAPRCKTEELQTSCTSRGGSPTAELLAWQISKILLLPRLSPSQHKVSAL